MEYAAVEPKKKVAKMQGKLKESVINHS